MELLGSMALLVALGVGAFGLVYLARVLHRRHERRAAPKSGELDPNDLAELAASLDAIASAYDAERPTNREAQQRLASLINRRCPVRAVSPAPVHGVARVSFADGTAILVRSQGLAVARLMVEVARTPICLCSSSEEGDVLELVFEFHGALVAVEFVGFDQAD